MSVMLRGVRTSVTLCDGGVKIGQKKRYIIVERPHNFVKTLNRILLLCTSWSFFIYIDLCHVALCRIKYRMKAEYAPE